jgi:hypothetical protein
VVAAHGPDWEEAGAMQRSQTVQLLSTLCIAGLTINSMYTMCYRQCGGPGVLRAALGCHHVPWRWSLPHATHNAHVSRACCPTMLAALHLL